MRLGGGLDILAGIWLIIAPFLLNYSARGGSTSNDIVVGVIILILSALQMRGAESQVTWPSWIATLLGLWLIIAPFSLGYAGGTAGEYNDIIVGIIVAVVSLWGALGGSREQ